MIELTFDDSTAGNLLYNSSIGTQEIIRDEIVSLNLMLDFGYLEEDLESHYRMGYIDYHYLVEYDHNETDWDSVELGSRNRTQMEKLKSLLFSGKSVRIWVDDTPNAICGLYAISSFLLDYKNDVFVIKCPRCINYADVWCIAPSWGTFNGVRIDEFLPATRKLEQGEMAEYATYWERLVEENAPLRAVIAGLPVSVSEDFYDRFLYEFIPDKPIRLGSLVSQVTWKYYFGLNVLWYENRIYELIKNGEMEIVNRGVYYDDIVVQKTKKFKNPFLNSDACQATDLTY